MGIIVSSGKGKLATFLIVPQDTEYNATVTTETEKYETKCVAFQAARRWVDNIITRIEERNDENGRID